MCPAEFLPASGTATLEGAPLVRSLRRVSLREDSSDHIPACQCPSSWVATMRASHLLAVLALTASLACGDGMAPEDAPALSWTWISGSSSVAQSGVYGTQGTASPSNVPGARYYSVSWIDAADNLWLFGGLGYVGILGDLNDLWRFDGTNWTWVSGGSSNGQSGVYGTLGTASPSLWLFGGFGVAAVGSGWLNDLWRFRP